METVRVIRIIVVVTCATCIVGYLLVSRTLWFPELDKQIRISHHRLTKPVDLTQPGLVTWKIGSEDWNYEGECRVSLMVDKIPSIPWESYQKGSMTLQVKMDAYAITYEPTASGKNIEGLRANRLIRNWYFKTDAPLSPDARIWESGNSSGTEFGLCGVQRYPWEDTYVLFEIVRPDNVLAKANPQLQIVGDYDYAVQEHISWLRIFRDSVLFLLIMCVLALAYMAIKYSSLRANT